MAAVSQHAMRRHPGSPLDSTPPINSPYYAVAHQQTLSNHNDSKSSSKKSWSQRLKITKNDKQQNASDQQPDNANHSHAMKYADSMYYGTVREGMPPGAIGHPRSAQFYAPMREIPTVMLCSCTEYMLGTKKDTKKPTVCKKCRGARVPLAQFGGTVRLHSTAPMHAQTMRASVGTVRLPSTSSGKQRPSILTVNPPDSDPYDMMRRSRLVSPELQPVNNVLKKPPSTEGNQLSAAAQKKSRAKSTSPLRGRRSRSRSRTRRSPSPPPLTLPSTPSTHRNESWVTENELGAPDAMGQPSNVGRRSILHCDLSAYELISKISHNNEFSPMADDDDLYGMMPSSSTMMMAAKQLKHQRSLSPPLHSPPPDYHGSGLPDVTALAGQRMNFSSSKVALVSPSQVHGGDAFVYDRVGYAASDVSDTASQKSGRRAIKSPVRPPRGQHRKVPESLSTFDGDGGESGAADGTKCDFVLTASVLSHISNDIMPSSPPAIVIKSILKRPTSNGSESQPSSLGASGSSNGDGDYGTSANESGGIRFARGKVSIALSKNIVHGPAGTAPTSQSPTVSSPSTTSSSATTKEKRSSGSHFYLPMPHRKKVQFLVDSDTGSGSSTGHTEESYFGEHAVSNGAADMLTIMDAHVNGDAPLLSDRTAADLLIGNIGGVADLLQSPNQSVVAHADDYAPTTSSTHVGGAVGADAQSYAAVVTAASAAVIEIIPTDIMRTADNSSVAAPGIRSVAAETSAALDGANNEDNNLPSPTTTTTPSITNAAAAQLRRITLRDRRRLSDPAVQPRFASHVSFHDTTALRHKANRNDTRTLFDDMPTATTVVRPRDPPPPPPPALTVASSSSSSQSPARPPRQGAQSLPTSPASINAHVDYEPIVFGPQHRQRQLQANNEARQGSRLFSAAATNGTNSKKGGGVVLKIAPLVIGRDASAVHRLQIRNEAAEPATYDSASKKTSIMISGDDCYSTVNVSSDCPPMYHASVVVNGGDAVAPPSIVKNSTNTVSISVTTPVESNDYLATLQSPSANRSIIPIPDGRPYANQSRTLITVDYSEPEVAAMAAGATVETSKGSIEIKDVISNDQELLKMLRNPTADGVTVPHVCGRHSNSGTLEPVPKKSPDTRKPTSNAAAVVERDSFIGKLLEDPTLGHLAEGLDGDIVAKLIENSLLRLKETRSVHNDPASGGSGTTKDEQDMNKLIELSLLRIKEERHKLGLAASATTAVDLLPEPHSNRDSMSSANSFSSANYEAFDFDTNELSDCYQSCSSELTGDDDNSLLGGTRSRFYQMLVDATLSEIEISTNAPALDGEDEGRNGDDEEDDEDDVDDDHHYESIRLNGDPIYEEINDMPPPLPLCPPPQNDADADKKLSKSMFEGASKYDILSYLVDAKERGLVAEDTYTYNFSNTSDTIIIEEDNGGNVPGVGALLTTTAAGSKSAAMAAERLHNRRNNNANDPSSTTGRLVQTTTGDDDDASLLHDDDEIAALKMIAERKSSSDIERNDSGVGSETSKNSRSKYQSTTIGGGGSILVPTTTASIGLLGGSLLHKNSPIHLCEDCDGAVETQITESGVMFAPLVCRKCGKKRAERKEIVTEIIETEEKYGRDLQIILEEFYQPMLVAGLLTQEQLSAIFLNAEELLENSQALSDKMRDAFDIALEQGDDDLLTVNIGRLMLDAAPMLHAFESYCVRQAAASLLLANMEKEKELLRIFLRVSQMENTVLRRMNLNSFLMVPVQRVTKYPLLLARLYKVTPGHLDGRDLLRQAQEKIELHLNHMNREAKDVPTKLWRRISSSSPNRRSSCEIDMINIKLRKMAIDLLEWHHDEVRFPVEGKLLFTQPTDNNWRKGRTIKLTPVNALLVTNGKPSAAYKADKSSLADPLSFPRHTGIREATLLLVREKSGRYTLLREPLFLDRCIVCTEADWEDYFELQEISSKETFIFKAEDGARTKQWYTQLQHHSQGMGAWRKRRNALANIMINGMMMRS